MTAHQETKTEEMYELDQMENVNYKYSVSVKDRELVTQDDWRVTGEARKRISMQHVMQARSGTCNTRWKHKNSTQYNWLSITTSV